MPKKYKISLIIIGILIVMSIIGFTYAFIAKQGVAGNEDNTIVLTTVDYGRITVSFEDGNNQIAASYVELPEEEAGTDYYYMLKFEIESTANIEQQIQIKWKDLENTFCTGSGYYYYDGDYMDYGCEAYSDLVEWANNDSKTVSEYVEWYNNEYGPNDIIADSSQELTYALYSCTYNEYNNVTTADDTDIASCTKVSNETDQTIPESENTSNLHADSNITLEPNSTTYYILKIKLKNLETDQSYQQGASLAGTINVLIDDSWSTKCTTGNTYLNCNLVSDAVADNISSNYVASSSGIDFIYVNSPTNGQGIYTDNQLGTGENFYFRGGTYCTYTDYTLEDTSGTKCVAAGGTWDSTTYHCSLNDSESACTIAGGTYYELNNNVLYGGYAWKILRVNPDGSIRMVYNGTSTTARGTNTQIGTSVYNTNYDTGSGTTNWEAEQSSAKSYASYDGNDLETVVNTWYSSNFTSYSNYLADSEFCSDIGWGDISTSNWLFIPRTNLNTPSFNCSNEEGIYTVANGFLTYPVATITLDEITYSGSPLGANAYHNYLQTGTSYWTMSPDSWLSAGSIRAWGTSYYAGPNNSTINNSMGVRPVINLKSTVKIASGDGSLVSPYQIVTN